MDHRPEVRPRLWSFTIFSCLLTMGMCMVEVWRCGVCRAKTGLASRVLDALLDTRIIRVFPRTTRYPHGPSSCPFRSPFRTIAAVNPPPEKRRRLCTSQTTDSRNSYIFRLPRPSSTLLLPIGTRNSSLLQQRSVHYYQILARQYRLLYITPTPPNMVCIFRRTYPGQHMTSRRGT